MSGHNHNQAGQTRTDGRGIRLAPLARDDWFYCGRPGSTLHRGCHKRRLMEGWVESSPEERQWWAEQVGDDGVPDLAPQRVGRIPAAHPQPHPTDTQGQQGNRITKQEPPSR